MRPVVPREPLRQLLQHVRMDLGDVSRLQRVLLEVKQARVLVAGLRRRRLGVCQHSRSEQ